MGESCPKPKSATTCISTSHRQSAQADPSGPKPKSATTCISTFCLQNFRHFRIRSQTKIRYNLHFNPSEISFRTSSFLRPKPKSATTCISTGAGNTGTETLPVVPNQNPLQLAFQPDMICLRFIRATRPKPKSATTCISTRYWASGLGRVSGSQTKIRYNLHFNPIASGLSAS